MATCKCTCKICGRKFDRYSGHLLNLSDKALDELRGKVQSEKHFVLCSDCVETLLGRFIVPMSYLKWKSARNSSYWYTSNYLYCLRKIGVIYSCNSKIKCSDLHYQSIVEFCKKVENKGVLKWYTPYKLWNRENRCCNDILEIPHIED